MTLHGNVWLGGDDGNLAKVEIKVERTDRDEVAVFTGSEEVEQSTLYLTRQIATEVAAALISASEGETP